MAFTDYADSFDYCEKIVLEYAKALTKQIVDAAISDLQGMTDGLQSPSDSGLKNIWEEICVQKQSDYSAMWDFYDDLVYGLIEKKTSQLDDYALCALQYDLDFEERELSNLYDIDEIVNAVKISLYDAAAEDKSENVVAFLENEESF